MAWLALCVEGQTPLTADHAGRTGLCPLFGTPEIHLTMNQLDALKQFTTVVADTGDFKQLSAFQRDSAQSGARLRTTVASGKRRVRMTDDNSSSA